jgi:hypothetical protein
MSLFIYQRLMAPRLKSYKIRQASADILMIHRIKLGPTARDNMQAFTGAPGYNVPEAARATGGKMPYTFLIEPDGVGHTVPTT